MKVNHNVNSPNFGYLYINNTPKTVKLLRKLAKEKPEWLEEIQKAGELLGTPYDIKGAKNFHLIIDSYNVYPNSQELCTKCRTENNYWRPFNNGEYYSYNHRIVRFNGFNYDTFTLESLNSGEAFDVAKYSTDGIWIEHCDGKALAGIENSALIAKILKILDNYSVIFNSGSKTQLKEIKIPEIKVRMSIDKLLEKYGIF